MHLGNAPKCLNLSPMCPNNCVTYVVGMSPAASTMRNFSLWLKRRRVVRDEFEAELRGFFWFSAMIETPVWQECLERRKVSHHYWHGGLYRQYLWRLLASHPVHIE